MYVGQKKPLNFPPPKNTYKVWCEKSLTTGRRRDAAANMMQNRDIKNCLFLFEFIYAFVIPI